jgi:hypothetical protein
MFHGLLMIYRRIEYKLGELISYEYDIRFKYNHNIYSVINKLLIYPYIYSLIYLYYGNKYIVSTNREYNGFIVILFYL